MTLRKEAGDGRASVTSEEGVFIVSLKRDEIL